MKPPEFTKLFKSELATFWFDKNDMLCDLAKRAHRSLENQKENFAFIGQITGNKKVCLLSDATLASPQDNTTCAYTEKELPPLFKAMALLSKSVLGEIIPLAFLKLNSQPIPIKFFNEEKEVRNG